MIDLKQEKSITSIKKITRFEIGRIDVVLNTSATIELYLYDGENFVDLQLVKLDGENYLSWGYDDTFIISFCENYIKTM
jgi:hypothetical protein